MSWRPMRPRRTPESRPRRPITITWSCCGFVEKVQNTDPVFREEVKRRSKSGKCEACQKADREHGRRDIGVEDEDEDLLALFPGLRRAA
jgi:hypothetical protein